MVYLTEADVRRFLPMQDCIGLMQTAFERLNSGEAINQPRRRLHLPTKSTLHYMAGSDGRYFGAKIYSSHPRHGANFLFLLYRAEDAAPLAILEANALGQIRTGAASGLATKFLARPGSRTVAIVGSGFQARTQVEAMLAVLPSPEFKVWSRSPEKRDAFVRECAEQLGARIEAGNSAGETVADADVVVTATNSAEPVLEAAWIAPGTHINAMGSNQAKRRELPADLVMNAGLLVVDSVEQSRMESGDLLLALDGASWNTVLELKAVIARRVRRESAEQVTLFKSNGLAVEDVIAAGFVYEQAVAAGTAKPLYS